jgi:hypothetical protein
MKLTKYITNGTILVIIGLLHTQCAVTSSGFGKQFQEFSRIYFFKISPGASEFPAIAGKTNFETHAAFWFFYFGILLIPIGLLVHSVEKDKKYLPYSFTISYFVVVLVGCYMVPNSGMTFFMLPHALYMLIGNHIKTRKNFS